MNLLGSVFSVSLGFIFPIAIYHKRFKGSIEIRTYIMDYTVLVLGIVGGISGVYSTIISFWVFLFEIIHYILFKYLYDIKDNLAWFLTWVECHYHQESIQLWNDNH